MRHGHAAAASPIVEPERTTDNLISLEDFLAESEKTPNKVRRSKHTSLVSAKLLLVHVMFYTCIHNWIHSLCTCAHAYPCVLTSTLCILVNAHLH